MHSAPARIVSLVLAGFGILATGTSSIRAQAVPHPELYAVRDVRLAAPADSPRRTVILRGGRIESVQDASAELPLGARVIEGKGLFALPAFLDAYTQSGCATPAPVADRDAPPSASAEALVDMREANRKGIQPSFRAADAFQLEPEAQKRLRASGFGALLCAPAGQLLSGQSALASTRNAPPRDVLQTTVSFDHAGFHAEGPGYPGTLMGAIAQLRQFFLDAQHDQEIRARRLAGKPGSRPPYDADLEAILPAFAKSRRIVCEANSAGDIERWIALSGEFGFEVAISGGGEAWKRTASLRERGIPVFLTLDWGEEVEDPHAKDKQEGKKEKRGEEKKEEKQQEGAAEGESKGKEAPPEEPKSAKKVPEGAEWNYEKPLRVREEERRLWEEGRDCAIRLAEAGVPFAFGTGRGSPKELLDRVRTLVQEGLPDETALAALTSGSAALLGVGGEYGKIEPGFSASIALWTKDPLTAKDAKVAWLVADGFPHELEIDTAALEGKPDEGVDATGTWTLEFETPQGRTAIAELKMETEGEVRGTVRYRGPDDENERSGEFEGHVAGKKIRMSGTVKFGNFDAEVVIEAEIEKDEMSGTTTWKSSGREDVRRFTATRAPKRVGGDR